MKYRPKLLLTRIWREKLTDMESPSCSKSPPSCIINIAEIWGMAKSYENFIEDGLLDDPQQAHNDKEKHL